jgi:hypothetical protein
MTAFPSTEPEISVIFIGVYVIQSLVVYVAISACPSAEPEISFVLIVVFVTQFIQLKIE